MTFNHTALQSIALQRLCDDLPLPSYATTGSAGMDVYARIDQDVVLPPLQRVLIPCGFAIALPAGLEAQIRPRSGLALKHGISVLNAPGTIDSDYRGEIGVILWNGGDQDYVIKRQDRIAQMVIASYVQAVWQEGSLNRTTRAQGGFGSTGI